MKAGANDYLFWFDLIVFLNFFAVYRLCSDENRTQYGLVGSDPVPPSYALSPNDYLALKRSESEGLPLILFYSYWRYMYCLEMFILPKPTAL